jgi:DNA anti-recombination protein RmuC
MSDANVKTAREDVKRSQKQLEEAISRLGNEIEDRVARVAEVADQTKDFTQKIRDAVKDPVKTIDQYVDVDAVVGRARETFDELVNYSADKARVSAEELITDIRQAAEDELQKIDTRPVITLTAVLLGGFTLGFALARRSRAA